MRDLKKYEFKHIELLCAEERRVAEEISNKYKFKLHIHKMAFDESDLQKCCKLLSEEV